MAASVTHTPRRTKTALRGNFVMRDIRHFKTRPARGLAFGKHRRIFCRTPLDFSTRNTETAHDDAECEDKHSENKEKHRVPTTGKSEKRKHGDKCAREHDECVYGHILDNR